MTGMFLNDPALSSRLCLMLLHSTWQVAVCALLGLGASRVGRRRSVEREYLLSVAALVGSLAVCVLTFTLLAPSRGPVERQQAVAPKALGLQNSLPEKAVRLSSAADATTAQLADPDSTPARSAPPTESSAPFRIPVSQWLAALYAAGVFLMLVRLGIGVWQAHRTGRRGKLILEGPLAELAGRVSARLSLRVVPRLMRVEELVLPRVIGLIWPQILLPAAALSGLSPRELEFVLLHEMAHLRRHDLWVNLLQRLAEAVLFFNPALWYLSRRISHLREFCCDELTCRINEPTVHRTRIEYAQALLKVAELAQHALNGSPRAGASDHDDLIALAIGGSSSSQLRRRITALLGEPVREPLRLSVGELFVVAAVSLSLLFGAWRSAERTTKAADQPVAGATVGAKEKPVPRDSVRQSQSPKPAEPVHPPAAKMSPGLARLVAASRSAREGVQTVIGTATFSSWSTYDDDKEPKLMTRGTLQAYYDRGKYNVRFAHEKLLGWCRTMPEGVFPSRKKGEEWLFRDKRGALVEVPAKLCDCKPVHAILINNDHYLMLNTYSPRIHPDGVRASEPSNLRSACVELGLALWDPVLLGRDFVNMEAIVKNLGAEAIQVTPLPEGGYHGKYRLKNSPSWAEFDAPAKAGFHVTFQQTFNKGQALPAQVAHATWKLIDGQWVVTGLSTEMRFHGSKRNPVPNSMKIEIEYTAMQINSPVDPAAFTSVGFSETWTPKLR